MRGGALVTLAEHCSASAVYSINLRRFRNARPGGNIPTSARRAVGTCIAAGCHGITLHPRPDARQYHVSERGFESRARLIDRRVQDRVYPVSRSLSISS